VSGQIEIDKVSLDKLYSNFDILKKEGANEVWKMVVTFLFQVKFLAQNKLKYDKHIVTSRLRNSIFVKTPNQEHAVLPDNQLTFKDNDGKSWDADMKTVKLQANEGAVGTNVEYADKIEFRYDSFLYWGFKNADLKKAVSKISLEKLGFKR